ncbi:anti-sigma factor domain-containing protein [Leucobacter sp. NPDC015123]|uniref:anti-sigma factor n=1 Tax=Leucobacter sp. NPDC015123 TaxID=3364129 RepID=UPI0036F4823E
MNEQEFRVLSAGRALHALSPDEEQAFAAALAANPGWSEIVDADREVAAALGEAAADAGAGTVEPSQASRNAILAAIAGLPQDPASGENHGDRRASEHDDRDGRTAEALPEPERRVRDEFAPRPTRRWAGWFALAASIAVLATLSLTPFARDLFLPNDPVALALEQIADAPDAAVATATFGESGEASVHWSDSAQTAVFVAEGLPSLDDQRDFELWIVRGETPISLGVVHADGDSDTAMIATGFRPGDAVAVTVEARGGSPTGAPTSDPILVVASA